MEYFQCLWSFSFLFLSSIEDNVRFKLGGCYLLFSIFLFVYVNFYFMLFLFVVLVSLFFCYALR